jgi:glycosyltransferase involved in cell wall biosynthesis
MSVFNGAHYLREAVESVLNQTFTDFEFIIIDDASGDATSDILHEYSDPRIVRLRNEENLGLARSLNRGVSIACGEYIARQDADDVSLPQRLAQQVAYLDAYPRTGFVGTTAIWMDATGEALQVWQQPTGNPQIQERLLWYCCLMHGSVMMRRQALAEVGGRYAEDMRTGQDYDLWLRMSEKWDVAILPEPLYRYRWHENMATKMRSQEQTANAQQALARALRRRTALGWALVLSPLSKPPVWTARYSRREWADRFLWWAAGARAMGRGYPQRFAAFSFLLNPVNPNWWSFMRGVSRRKLRQYLDVAL